MTALGILWIALAVIGLALTLAGFVWAARADGRYQERYGDAGRGPGPGGRRGTRRRTDGGTAARRARRRDRCHPA